MKSGSTMDTPPTPRSQTPTALAVATPIPQQLPQNALNTTSLPYRIIYTRDYQWNYAHCAYCGMLLHLWARGWQVVWDGRLPYLHSCRGYDLSTPC